MLETLEDMEQQVCGVIQDSLKKSKAIYILQQERRQLRSQVGKLQQENARLRQQLARMAARQQVLQAQQGGADAAE
jgi:septal ring factor EnvC (AmiA/AmiB activator)